MSSIFSLTYSSGERESPWNMPLWIVTYARVYFPVGNSTLQFSMTFGMKFMTLLNILNIFRHSIIEVRGTWNVGLLVVNPCHDNIFPFIHLLLLSLLLLFHSTRDFHSRVSWWSFTGVWVTASLLISPGLFWEFNPILTTLWSGWYRLFLWSPIHPFFCLILRGPF